MLQILAAGHRRLCLGRIDISEDQITAELVETVLTHPAKTAQGGAASVIWIPEAKGGPAPLLLVPMAVDGVAAKHSGRFPIANTR